jgi:hypothetical protein
MLTQHNVNFRTIKSLFHNLLAGGPFAKGPALLGV